MNTLAERLKFALDKSGKKKTDLWKGCKLSSGAISHWFNNPSTQLKGKNLLCASRILGVRPEWLETGEGEIALTEREKLINQIMESLQSMPEDDVRHVSQLCGRLAKQERRSGEVLPRQDHAEDRRKEPSLGPRARASGYGSGETIRRGDLFLDDELTEKRKKDGNSI